MLDIYCLMLWLLNYRSFLLMYYLIYYLDISVLCSK